MVRITVGTERIPEKELGMKPAVLDGLAMSDSRRVLLYVVRHPNTKERTREIIMYECGLDREAIDAGMRGREENGHTYAGGKDPQRMTLDERSEWMRGNRLVTLLGTVEGVDALLRDAKKGTFYSPDRLRDIEIVCKMGLEGRDRNAIKVVSRARRMIAGDPKVLELLSDDAHRALAESLPKDMMLLARRE
ncbi:MAG: hypothetical protein KGH69_04980 [Candidatus Micrarchaeota archaeon]|nr:hypothetical protein [Candidatus Micrarchaeota archaeon]